MERCRKELLDDLYAACSGEAAAYACGEAARALRKKRQEMERSFLERRKPVRRLGTEHVRGMKPAVAALAAALPVFAGIRMASRSPGIGLICGLAAGAAAFELCLWRQGRRMAKDAGETDGRKEQAIYEREQARWRRRLTALTALASACEAEQEAIRTELAGLYERCALPGRFRNMIAVNCLRDWLESGQCAGLEAACGLYARRVREGSLCASPDELPERLECTQQGRMIQEMNVVEAQISQLCDALDDAFPEEFMKTAEASAHGRYIRRHRENMENQLPGRMRSGKME